VVELVALRIMQAVILRKTMADLVVVLPEFLLVHVADHLEHKLRKHKLLH
jgi:hypothetical protein